MLSDVGVVFREYVYFIIFFFQNMIDLHRTKFYIEYILRKKYHKIV